ncbi:hypothetical protein L6R53_12700 [Myxococcota bacterium]|nr:hypothetical protein [Myxococcota bacterium]
MILALLLACAEPAGPAGTDSGGSDPVASTTEHWALTTLSFVRVQEDGSSDGFDLDGDVTDAGDSDGCGIGDMTSPAGVQGIDNAFARLLPVLETTEFVGVEQIFQSLIETGELLLVAELADVHSLQDDDSVDLAMRRALGQPMLDTSGAVLADQTLDLDLGFGAPVIADVPLVAASVEARPFEVVLPVSFLDASFDLTVHGGAVRYDLAADGSMSGVFAGGLETAWLVQLTKETGISDEVQELLQSVLGGAADLAPDDAGQCTQISVTLGFSAVPVYVFADALEE